MNKVPSARCRDLVKASEKCVLKAYPDPASPLGKELKKPMASRVSDWQKLPGDPWTIGYGHTQKVFPKQIINNAQADKFLDSDLKHAAVLLKAKVGQAIIDELTQNQFDALVDFVFNVGVGDPQQKEWQIWGLLRAKRFDAARLQLARFVNAGNPPIPYEGLKKRRAAEMALWAENEPGSSEENLPSSVTRNAATPPTNVNEPARKSATLWTVVTTAVTGGVAYVAQHVHAAVQTVATILTPDHATQALAAVQPFVDKSNYVAQAAQGIAVVGALLAVIFVTKKINEGHR